MKLADLHKRFSRDKTYRVAYEEQRGWVALGLHARSLREDAVMSQVKLAQQLGISAHALSQFERGYKCPSAVARLVLNHWAAPLADYGFDLGVFIRIAEDRERLASEAKAPAPASEFAPFDPRAAPRVGLVHRRMEGVIKHAS